jgi:hypothetical protein
MDYKLSVLAPLLASMNLLAVYGADGLRVKKISDMLATPGIAVGKMASDIYLIDPATQVEYVPTAAR